MRLWKRFWTASCAGNKNLRLILRYQFWSKTTGMSLSWYCSIRTWKVAGCEKVKKYRKQKLSKIVWLCLHFRFWLWNPTFVCCVRSLLKSLINHCWKCCNREKYQLCKVQFATNESVQPVAEAIRRSGALKRDMTLSFVSWNYSTEILGSGKLFWHLRY